MSFADLCWFRAASAGSGDFVPASAIIGYLVPTDTEIIDGGSYSYVAQSDDESQKAYGSGTWDDGTNTLVRSSSERFVGAGFAGDFTAAPKVMLTPLARDLPGSVTSITTDNTAAFPDLVTVDPSYSFTMITTDGSGLPQTLVLPSLTLADADTTVTLSIVAFGDPADTVPLELSSMPNFYMELNENSPWATFKWDGELWFLAGGAVQSITTTYVQMIVHGGVIWESLQALFNEVPTPDPWMMFGSENNPEAEFVYRDPDDTMVYKDITTPETFPANHYLSKVTSGGTAGAEAFILTNGVTTGQRHLIKFVSQTDPGDVPTLDLTNVINDDNSVPASITLNVADPVTGDELWTVWQQYRDGNAGKWVILGASAGVVTP